MQQRPYIVNAAEDEMVCDNVNIRKRSAEDMRWSELYRNLLAYGHTRRGTRAELAKKYEEMDASGEHSSMPKRPKRALSVEDMTLLHTEMHYSFSSSLSGPIHGQNLSDGDILAHTEQVSHAKRKELEDFSHFQVD